MKLPITRVVAILCAAGALAACTSAVCAQTQTYLESIYAELNWPAYTGAPIGDPRRLFVLESRYGNMYALDLPTHTLSAPILHIDDLPDPINEEQGLLGLAFDPNFATNGYFYINYTGSFSQTYVRRYQMLGDPMTSNVVDLNSAQTILTITHPDFEHNAGWMNFGPNDGYLYISTGDGGGYNDEGPGHTYAVGNAQDIDDNLLGKILRIDVHSDDFPEDQNRNYSIPGSNPFVGHEGDDEIWAFGLRNPWRASFDRATGDLWIGDVGQGIREEIDYQPASSPGGENYGWRPREGTAATPGIGGPPPVGNVEPIYDYHHFLDGPNYSGQAVIGGFVYRGPVAELYGHYLFADHVTGNIWKLDPDAVNVRASVTKINSRLVPDVGAIGLISSFGEDAAGNLYMTRLFGPGAVFRIATHSATTVWKGADPSSGAPGDGNSWASTGNWVRNGQADQGFAAEDNVIFDSPSSNEPISLGGNRTVAALTFLSSETLQGDTLKVLSGNISVANGVTATISSALTAESALQSLRKLGPGRLIVEGTAGQTVVKEGTLGGVGTFDYLTVRGGAILAPGASAGIMTVTNSFKMQPGANLEIEIGGTSNWHDYFAQFDQILVGDTATLDGVLVVSLIDAGHGEGEYVPRAGDYFQIVSAAEGLTGTFDFVSLPGLSSRLQWKQAYTSSGFYLSIAPALSGDFNADGAVNAADYTVWRNSRGQTGWNLPADSSGPSGLPDGVVDNWDYVNWKTNYGNTISEEESTAVPEPAALALAVLGFVSLLSHRRTRRLPS